MRAVLWATPGQLDAGFASLATFITGLLAVRELSTGALAAYALLSSAYRVLNQFPSQLIFSPSQILAIDLPTERRLGSLAFSIPRGVFFSVVSALAVPVGGLLVASQVDRSELIALSATAVLLAAVSPVQDHVRAVLHMSNVSWMAAVTSATNLVATGTSLIFLRSSVAWAVFGALFVGNLISLVIAGLWIVARRTPSPDKPTMRELYWLGGWLLATGLGKTSIRYGVNAILSVFAGVAALGYVQGAEVVAQPVNVFSQGIMAQVGPHLTEAAARRKSSMARRWSARFGYLLLLAVLPYLAWVAVPWSLNPFGALAPRAYEVSGLVAATVLAIGGTAYMRSLRLQLLGARRQKRVAMVTFVSGGVELIAATSGALIGAFAAPISSGAATVFTIIWFRRILTSVYKEPPPGSASEESSD